MLIRWILSLLFAFVLSCCSFSLFDKLPKFSGTNQYYLFYKSQKMIDEIFDDAKLLNISVVRTWAFCENSFHDGYCFQPEPYVYHEPTFKKLDYIIAKAKQNNIRLILTLSNNWKDFGGIPQYLRWFNLSEHDDFYRDERVKNTFKAYVKHLLTRVNTLTNVPYKNEGTILAWELMNEPKSHDLPSLYDWVDEMARYIKELDPNHLVTTGSEGAISGDVYELHKSEAIDFISFHLYPDGWGFDEDRAKSYIYDHVKIAQHMMKPLFLGEFGLRDKQKRRRVYQEWYQIFRDEKIDGVAFWLLSGTQDDGSLYPDYDGFSVYYPESYDVIDVIQTYGQDVNEDYLMSN